MTKQQPTLTIDIQEFEYLLESVDATDEEKREYLETLWQIICEFVQLGWGVHPLQQVIDNNTACGKDSKNATESKPLSADMLSSFNTASANNEPANAAKGA